MTSTPTLIQLALLTALSLSLINCGGKEKKEDTPKTEAAKVESKASTKESESKSTKTTEVKETTPSLPWGYEGEKGPNFWGLLDPLYMACSKGKSQSPIDLKWKKPAKGRPLQFDYKPSSLSLVDTGHSIQINFDPGSSLVLGGDNYELVHAQFRTSSEHTLSGNELPMELQFYHRNKQGKIAVVSVIMIEGRENSTIKEIWSHLPKKMSEVQEKDTQINPIELLPPTLTYYHYTGSLTYPPCTEGVDWNVLNTPVTVSRDQILAYRKIYSRNKRQTQPLNGRRVTNY